MLFEVTYTALIGSIVYRGLCNVSFCCLAWVLFSLSSVILIYPFGGLYRHGKYHSINKAILSVSQSVSQSISILMFKLHCSFLPLLTRGVGTMGVSVLFHWNAFINLIMAVF